MEINYNKERMEEDGNPIRTIQRLPEHAKKDKIGIGTDGETHGEAVGADQGGTIIGIQMGNQAIHLDNSRLNTGSHDGTWSV